MKWEAGEAVRQAITFISPLFTDARFGSSGS